MAGITLAVAEQKLQMWLDALDALATSQSYTISTGGGSRQLTRASLPDVQAQVDYWDRQVKRLERGGIRVRSGVPCG